MLNPDKVYALTRDDINKDNNDPFVILTLEEILKVRNEALTKRDDEQFDMFGHTFMMPVALIKANTRLMRGK